MRVRVKCAAKPSHLVAAPDGAAGRPRRGEGRRDTRSATPLSVSHTLYMLTRHTKQNFGLDRVDIARCARGDRDLQSSSVFARLEKSRRAKRLHTIAGRTARNTGSHRHRHVVCLVDTPIPCRLLRLLCHHRPHRQLSTHRLTPAPSWWRNRRPAVPHHGSQALL